MSKKKTESKENPKKDAKEVKSKGNGLTPPEIKEFDPEKEKSASDFYVKALTELSDQYNSKLAELLKENVQLKHENETLTKLYKELNEKGNQTNESSENKETAQSNTPEVKEDNKEGNQEDQGVKAYVPPATLIIDNKLYQRHNNPKSKGGTFTKEEADRLLDLFKSHNLIGVIKEVPKKHLVNPGSGSKFIIYKSIVTQVKSGTAVIIQDDEKE